MRPLRVTLRQLEYFVAAVDAGTMSAAAESFVVSQSAISLAIAQLERTLGSQLLLRSKAKGLALTPAGAQLLVEARDLLGKAFELEGSARRLGNDLSGELVVGMFPMLTTFFTPAIVQCAADRHPGMMIGLRDGTADELQDWLLDGRCEVAIGYDLNIRAGITTIPLFRARPYVLVAASHPLAHRCRVRLQDLADFPGILLDYRETVEWLEELCARSGAKLKIVHRVRDLESLRALVAAGSGWTLLFHGPAAGSDGVRSDLRVLEIVDHQANTVHPGLDVVVCVPNAARLTGRVRAFIELCVDLLSGETVKRIPERRIEDHIPALHTA